MLEIARLYFFEKICCSRQLSLLFAIYPCYYASHKSRCNDTYIEFNMKTNYYTKSELDTARNAIRQTAVANKKSENEIRKDIKIALIASILNNTHGVTFNWKDIPSKGEYPTPEEFIAWCSRQCKQIL